MAAITRENYPDGASPVRPRAIASQDAFENAMALDVAMGGSTNTILHLLAAAHEAGGGFGREGGGGVSRGGDARRHGAALPVALPLKGPSDEFLPRRGLPPRGRHPHDPRRTGPGRAPQPDRAH